MSTRDFPDKNFATLKNHFKFFSTQNFFKKIISSKQPSKHHQQISGSQPRLIK